jgi:hypothetical protein
MSGITQYRCELIAAVLRSDVKLATMIVDDFCSRISDSAGKFDHGWLMSDAAEEIKVTSGGFYIKMAGKYLHCKRHRERWCVSESNDDTPRPSDAHLDFVAYAGAPFPFFEGVRFAIECMETVAEKSTSNVFADLERKYKEARLKYERELEHWSRIRDERDKYEDRLARILTTMRTAKNVAATQRAVSLPVAGLDAMASSLPQPPKDTVSVLCAIENMAGVSGIYFIWRGGEIVYVGRSQCVSSRLKTHHVADTSDHVSVVAMPNGETYLAELVYIAAYKPRLNGQVRDSIGEKKTRKKASA